MKLLLLLQRDLPIASAPHIDAWQRQLESEGYVVTRAYGPRANTKLPFQARDFAAATVWPWVIANPGGYVFLVGDLPMPRSGLHINPDGHQDSSGAYASTMFYACPHGAWTDEGTSSPFGRNAVLNFPGDGKWDQEQGTAAPGMFSTGPLMAKVGFFNPYFNPKTFLSPLDSIDYVTDCIKRYFELNIAYRTGANQAARVAVGVEKGNQNAGILQWATDAAGGLANVTQFIRATSATVPLNLLMEDDLKGRSESNAYWCDKANGVLRCVFGKTWGSHQIDYRSLRVTNPMNCGYLGVGSMGRNWNMAGWREKTLGELWAQSVNIPQTATHIVLYGDPTLRLAID